MRAGPSRLNLGSGLLLGVFGGAWSAIIAFLCVPWYIRFLGIESYGLIGFFVTLQAVIAILDLGVGATINREVARSAALNDLDRARRLLRSLELVYAVVALAIAGLVIAAAPLIAANWLKPAALPAEEVVRAIRMMGVVIALRWPVGLYYGTLIGLQRPQDSYRVIAATTTIANVGAVLVLFAIERSVAAFFMWQGATAVLALFWAWRSAWRALEGSKGTPFDRPLLGSVLLQSVLMSGVAITGAILSQVDKFVVSSSISLADFGGYSLAVVLASALSVLFIPTFNLIYPRLSALTATGREDERIAFYRLGTRLFLSCMLPIALSGFFYANDILALWTGDAALAGRVAPIAGWICLGSALNGLMHFPYALQLASENTRLPLLINCSLIAVSVPLTVALVKQFGALGGAYGWLAMNAVYVVIGVWATHRFLLHGLARRWVFLDAVPAFGVAAAVVGGGFWLMSNADFGHVIRLALATVFSIAATAVLLLLVYRNARSLALEGLSALAVRLGSRQGPTV